MVSKICVASAVLLALLVPQSAPAQDGGLRVGAARINITPPNAHPASIRDSLYVRAIVIDDGATRAVLISADQASVGEAIWSAASREISELLDTPVENIVISATHTHSAGGPNSFLSSPLLREALPEVVRRASASLRPAQVSYGVGSAYLNVNRDAIHPETRLWYQGPNLEGVSDKSVPVIGFWTTDGEPIAAFYSYSMHPVNFYNTGFISADFIGEAARHIETVLGPDFVTLFAQAPSGDQNPLYTRISSPVPAAVEQVPLDLPPGDEAQPASLRVVAGVDEFVRAAGVILGQEVMRVMYTSARSTDARISGAQTIVTCPGRTRLDSARQGVPGEYED
ncbi:MAG TPA: neutral/alkaline non-lysosomal ceramidase N-terminal domain-containing protein, partial [Longimicrobiales bacterium]|nr:neutral/alkaline non-lysosomal ceramidase N-terminal domain-containing protein [Longimicrobiales bacterium]